MADIEVYIEAAEQHGQNSDPDHEVGDLQAYLRAMWELLSIPQKKVFATRVPVCDTLEAALIGIPAPDLVTEVNLVAVFGAQGEHPDYPRGDWEVEVSNGDTQRSYWDWVQASIERDTQDPSRHLDSSD